MNKTVEQIQNDLENNQMYKSISKYNEAKQFSTGDVEDETKVKLLNKKAVKAIGKDIGFDFSDDFLELNYYYSEDQYKGKKIIGGRFIYFVESDIKDLNGLFSGVGFETVAEKFLGKTKPAKLHVMKARAKDSSRKSAHIENGWIIAKYKHHNFKFKEIKTSNIFKA